MKLCWQIILGLVLVFAVMTSFARAGSLEDDEEADSSLIGDSESDESGASAADVQQDYLNVGDYVRPPPPWWF